MNLNENPLGRDYYKSVFGESIAKFDDCTIYEVALPCVNHIPLLDCWHFSGRFSEEMYIYRPIINVLRAIDFYKTHK